MVKSFRLKTLNFLKGQTDDDDHQIPPSSFPNDGIQSQSLSETHAELGEDMPDQPNKVLMYTSIQLLS